MQGVWGVIGKMNNKIYWLYRKIKTKIINLGKSIVISIFQLIKRMPVVALLALIVAVLEFKGQFEANRPYIFVEPLQLQNVKLMGSAFYLKIGNSGVHPAAEIKLKSQTD